MLLASTAANGITLLPDLDFLNIGLPADLNPTPRPTLITHLRPPLFDLAQGTESVDVNFFRRASFPARPHPYRGIETPQG